MYLLRTNLPTYLLKALVENMDICANRYHSNPAIAVWSFELKKKNTFLPNALRYVQRISLFENLQVSTVRHLDKSFITKKISMECWWNDNGRRNSKVIGEKPFPLAYRQPQMQHGLTRERTRVLAVNMRNKLRALCINFYVVPYREHLVFKPGRQISECCIGICKIHKELTNTRVLISP